MSFNPLPSQKQGETPARPSSRGPITCFNPLPSQKQGETTATEVKDAPSGVSIRSPHKSKGRPQDLFCACAIFFCFNPLPSQKQGETGPARRSHPPHHVSIRSPHKSKGRPGGRLFSELAGQVSIRSPHKSKGRPAASLCLTTYILFQSAPLTKARGDLRSWNIWSGMIICFNPLPSQKQGETRRGGEHRRGHDRFNPLPSQKQGETWVRGGFPSSPDCFNPLPSQKQGETGWMGRNPRSTRCFNPLPSQKQGETQDLFCACAIFFCFNPLPSQKQGETRGQASESLQRGVSIRSPHKSKGRPRTKAFAATNPPFQSAPLTKARGDE